MPPLTTKIGTIRTISRVGGDSSPAVRTEGV
jgi:hypothetical protein